MFPIFAYPLTKIQEIIIQLTKTLLFICVDMNFTNESQCRRGHDHMVVGFTTTCAISAYHH